MSNNASRSQVVSQDQRSQSSTLVREGISTSSAFARLMGALIADVIDGNITPDVCNAAVNASGKLLKAVEMQHRYGHRTGDGSAKDLVLYSDVPKARVAG